MDNNFNALLIQAAREGARAFYEEFVAENGGKVFSAPVTTSTEKTEAKDDRGALRGTREAAKFLRVSTSTFQSLKNEGKIKPTYQIGDSYFYDPAELRAQVQAIHA